MTSRQRILLLKNTVPIPANAISIWKMRNDGFYIYTYGLESLFSCLSRKEGFFILSFGEGLRHD